MLGMLYGYGGKTFRSASGETRKETFGKMLKSFNGEFPSPARVTALLDAKVLKKVMQCVVLSMQSLIEKHQGQMESEILIEFNAHKDEELGEFRELIHNYLPLKETFARGPIVIPDSVKPLSWGTRMNILQAHVKGAVEELASDEERREPSVAYDPMIHSYKREIDENPKGLTFYDYYMSTNLSELLGTAKWRNMKSIFCVTRRDVPNDTNKRVEQEVKRYACSIDDIDLAVYSMRCIWFIEEMLALL
jgi:hypothetical protein